MNIQGSGHAVSDNSDNKQPLLPPPRQIEHPENPVDRK